MLTNKKCYDIISTQARGYAVKKKFDERTTQCVDVAISRGAADNLKRNDSPDVPATCLQNLKFERYKIKTNYVR